jgi:uncharacterized protein YukE
MPKLGLDPEALAALQRQLKADAEAIKSLTAKLDGLLKAAWWEGPDATRFRSDWDGIHRTQLGRISLELDNAAKNVATNVTQQQQASSG